LIVFDYELYGGYNASYFDLLISEYDFPSHFRGVYPLTGLRLQEIKARRPQKMSFNSLSKTIAYIKVADGLKARAAIATAGFAGLTVSELQGLY
jgi:hypothetical protein